MDIFKKRPALMLGLLASLATAAVEVINQATANGEFNGWTAVKVGLPLLAGILTQANVVAVETVRATIARSRSANAAVADLANRVDAAVPDRPGQ